MTDETTVAPRSQLPIPDETRADTIVIRCDPETWIPDEIEATYNGRRTWSMGFSRGSFPDAQKIAQIHALARRIEAGAALEIDVYPNGRHVWGEQPAIDDMYYRRRNIFLRYPLPRPQAETRREKVAAWARENTDPRVMMRFVINPDRARAPAEVLDRKAREKGQIWWEFVLMTLAAAQTDEWLADGDPVWAAIERNMEVDVEAFFVHCDVDDWNEPAAYMHALSRVYKAPTLLNDAPIEVTPDGDTLPNLHAGSAAAKRVIYRG